jgi:hypothetical protein
MSTNKSKFDLNDEYKKLITKKNLFTKLNVNNNKEIKVYEELLVKNNNKSLKLNNVSYQSLFNKDNELFNKFSVSVPYSQYNFLYGIDKHSKLDEERLVALLYSTKIIFAFALEPHYALQMTAAVIALLLSRFALDYYRKYKRSIEQNIVFCHSYNFWFWPRQSIILQWCEEVKKDWRRSC